MTALDGEETQLRGFKLDIDDYVTKPFSMPVLLEKIRVILRRSDRMDEKREAENCLRCRDLTLCPDTREAFAGGRLLDLTAREFDLLRTFLEAPGRVFTREMLLARLWGYDFYGDGRVVDTHIKNLRRKLGQDYICLLYTSPSCFRGAVFFIKRRCRWTNFLPVPWPTNICWIPVTALL